MKHFVLFTALMLIAYSGKTQETIQISFEIVQNGNQLVLDSAYVENQSRNCDTTLYFPEDKLNITMLSGIRDIFSADNGKLVIHSIYPNPYEKSTKVELYSASHEIHMQVRSIEGKELFRQTYGITPGFHRFILSGGGQQQLIIHTESGGDSASMPVISHTGNKNPVSVSYEGKIEKLQAKSTRESVFTFQSGDNLYCTAWVTACGNAESTDQSASPAGSTGISFDFTHLTDLQANTPEISGITENENSILWDWSEVGDCNGYKYNFTSNYAEATDLGMVTELEQTGLPAGTNFELFAWAYNDCGESRPLHMHKATKALPFTETENDSILSAADNVSMELMNIFEQPDSIILRTPSTNVLADEINLNHLTERMRYTVGTNSGVGIAAPQVGINRRIIWVQRWDKGSIIHPWEVYFNPRIVEYSDTIVYKSDGCLSVPTGEDYPEVDGFSYRAIWVLVEYINSAGELVTERINHQYTAHIFQHEIDHLNGIMFFDRQVERN